MYKGNGISYVSSHQSMCIFVCHVPIRFIIEYTLSRDGATRSGLFCAISCMANRLKNEQEVDVLQDVKTIRISRPQVVPDLVSCVFVYLSPRSFLPVSHHVLSFAIWLKIFRKR